MALLSDSIQDLFLRAGWLPGRKSGFTPEGTFNSHAEAVLSKFGGLHIGTCGPGLECASSDVKFLSTPWTHGSMITKAWRNAVGDLTAIADAHHGHMVLFVSATGVYYIFTDPDCKLYFGGQSFAELMERVLLGIAYGKPIGQA